MKRNRKLLVTGVVVLALGAGGAGIAQAVGDDSDEQASGPEADRAKQAAVEAVGGGRAAGVERDDEGGGWEVEVIRRDGSAVEVDLGNDLKRTGTETDDGDRESADRAEGRDDTEDRDERDETDNDDD